MLTGAAPKELFAKVLYVVLDEADRLFEAAFAPDLDVILRHANPPPEVLAATAAAAASEEKTGRVDTAAKAAAKGATTTLDAKGKAPVKAEEEEVDYAVLFGLKKRKPLATEGAPERSGSSVSYGSSFRRRQTLLFSATMPIELTAKRSAAAAAATASSPVILPLLALKEPVRCDVTPRSFLATALSHTAAPNLKHSYVFMPAKVKSAYLFQTLLTMLAPSLHGLAGSNKTADGGSGGTLLSKRLRRKASARKQERDRERSAGAGKGAGKDSGRGNGKSTGNEEKDELLASLAASAARGAGRRGSRSFVLGKKGQRIGGKAPRGVEDMDDDDRLRMVMDTDNAQKKRSRRHGSDSESDKDEDGSEEEDDGDSEAESGSGFGDEDDEDEEGEDEEDASADDDDDEEEEDEVSAEGSESEDEEEVEEEDEEAATDIGNCRSVIVFTSTCRNCQLIAEMLIELGLPCTPLHSVLSQQKRTASLARFRGQTVRVLIATDVASRGLDIPSVDLVVNYDLPQDPADYVHRVGRTARAGRGGRAISLVSQFEVALVQSIEQAVLGGRRMQALPGAEDLEERVLMRLGKVTTAFHIAKSRLEEQGFEQTLATHANRKRDARERTKQYLASKSTSKQ
jgi:superfamily II DNA/RNA helicase